MIFCSWSLWAWVLCCDRVLYPGHTAAQLIITHPEIIYGLFFGLILASIVILMREVDNYGIKDFIITLAGVALGFSIVTLVPLETPTAAWFIFLCGFIAISAMLLPASRVHSFC